MTIFADRYPLVRWPAYIYAGCMSLSRIYEDAHWTSDVLLGALVGYTVARMTLRTDNRFLANITILPYLTKDERGLKFQYRF